MTNTTAETSTAKSSRTDGGADKAPTRTRRARTSSGEESDGGVRYFLAKPEGDDGLPALDREVADESEALVEALRLRVTFYAVQEFRVIPDLSGRRPQLNKEEVDLSAGLVRSRTWLETENVFSQDGEGTARAPSFLSWQYADRKGRNDGEEAISGSVPALVLHCGKSLRTNSAVQAVCVGPAALSVRAPWHVGFADGSVIGFPAHGLAVLAVGSGRVDMVQAAKVTGLRERATAMLQKLLES